MGTSQMVVGVVLHRARTKLKRKIAAYMAKHGKTIITVIHLKALGEKTS